MYIHSAAQAAAIAVECVRKELSAAMYNSKKAQKAAEHLKGFVWSKSMINKVGNREVLRLVNLINATSLHKEVAEQCVQMFKSAYFDPSITFPPEMGNAAAHDHYVPHV